MCERRDGEIRGRRLAATPRAAFSCAAILLLLLQPACASCPADFLAGAQCHIPSGTSCSTGAWASTSCTDLYINGTLTSTDLLNVSANSLTLGAGASLSSSTLVLNVGSLIMETGASSSATTSMTITATVLVWLKSSASMSAASITLEADVVQQDAGSTITCSPVLCPVDILVGNATLAGTTDGGDVRISATSNVDVSGTITCAAKGQDESTVSTPTENFIIEDYRDIEYPTTFGDTQGNYGWMAGGGRILLEACNEIRLDGQLVADGSGSSGSPSSNGGSILLRSHTMSGTGTFSSLGDGSLGQPGLVAVHAKIVLNKQSPSTTNLINYFESNGPELLHYPRYGTADATRPSCAGATPTPSPLSPSCESQEVNVIDANLTVTVPALLDGSVASVSCPRNYRGFAIATCGLGQVTAGSVLHFSPFMSCKMRAFFVWMEIISSLFTSTVFYASTGGTQRRSLDAGTRQLISSDNGDDPCATPSPKDDFWYLAGRAVAVSLFSAVVASIPLLVVGSLSTRGLRQVDYRGSPDWNKQLRAWIIQDWTIWVVGSAYLVFCHFFIVLFLANMDKNFAKDWIVTTGLGVIYHCILIPTGFAVLMPLMAASSVGLLSFIGSMRRDDLIRGIHEHLHRKSNAMLPIMHI